jgi:hypothetical protein
LHANFSIDVRSLDRLKLATLPIDRRERVIQEARRYGCLVGITREELNAFRKQLDDFVDNLRSGVTAQSSPPPSTETQV